MLNYVIQGGKFMDEQQQQKLKRSLKSRHVTMIAIGGAIGTGLFLGSGSAIHKAGPSIILSYLIVGIFCFFMSEPLWADFMILVSIPLLFCEEYLGDRWNSWPGGCTSLLVDLSNATWRPRVTRYWFQVTTVGVRSLWFYWCWLTCQRRLVGELELVLND